jgi:predicted alpha/beta-fold hydrolase
VVREMSASGVPLTIWTPPQPRGPVVVVVHGLAGSHQVMQP